MEVTNRFKGLDLIECLKKYGQWSVTLCRRQCSRFKRLDLIEYLMNYGQRFVTLYRRQ